MNKSAKNASETVATLDDDVIETVIDAAPVNAPSVTAPSHHGFSGQKVRVVINEGEGDAGREAVYVALNEYSAQIPRNQECVIPIEVFNSCIKAAKVSTLVRTRDGLDERTVNRFSYSMLGAA